MLILLSFLLGACGNQEAEVVIIPVEGSTAETSPETSPAPEGGENMEAEIVPEGGEAQSGPELIRSVSPDEAWEMYGYVHFKAEKTGLYNFELINSEGIDWEVYALSEEFPDAERYIPQVYEPVLVGAGAVEIQEGQFIYLYSSANSWTMIETPEGCLCNITFIA